MEKLISLGGKKLCMECCSRKEGSRIAWLLAGVWKLKRIRRNIGKGRWQTLLRGCWKLEIGMRFFKNEKWLKYEFREIVRKILSYNNRS
jgi:hypothetical protein